MEENNLDDYDDDVYETKPIPIALTKMIYRRKVDTFYNCQYLRHMEKPTPFVGKRMVVTAGFIPLKTRIENMVAAGLDLQTKREEMFPDMYDYEMNLVDEDFDEDPDEISVMENGTRAEEALGRRRRIYNRINAGEESNYSEYKNEDAVLKTEKNPKSKKNNKQKQDDFQDED